MISQATCEASQYRLDHLYHLSPPRLDEAKFSSSVKMHPPARTKLSQCPTRSCSQIRLKGSGIELRVHCHDLYQHRIDVKDNEAANLELVTAHTGCHPPPTDLVAGGKDAQGRNDW